MNKLKSCLLLLFAIGLTRISFGQDDSLSSAFDYNEPYIVKDPRVDLLIEQQIFLNKLALKTVSGYRVQVISTSDRNAANRARARVMRLYPRYKAYLSYQAPYFRVRVGNFYERDSADILSSRLSPYFTDGVFVVREKINIDPDILLEEIKAKDEKGD